MRSLQPRGDADLVAMLRDETAAARLIATLSPFFHEDVEILVPKSVLGASMRYLGLEGLRAGWLDWLEPWESYRVEVDEVIDAGDEVAVLVRDFGRRAGMTAEASVLGGAVWTVRDGRVGRIVFYLNRDEALKAVGLEG